MVSRRLAAIVAADVAGYSRLMHAAEEFTHDRLAHLMSETIGPKVAEHGGRVVKTAGDGFLAEFASAVLAVKCAVEFQDAMRDLTASDPEERRIAFRVGIHIGDVIVEAHDLFGDGVNIAARLEALSDPGGILVSAPVHENVLGRLACAFDDLGELVDARSGAHVWADRFDGTLEDVFDLQDRVTASVVAAIEPKLRSAEIERAQRKPAGNLEAYDLLLRAQPHRYSFTREGLREAERLLRKATEIDPRYALGFAHLAHCLWQLVNQGWMERPDEGGREAVRSARFALAQDPDDPEILSIAAHMIALPGGDLNAGIGLAEKSTALNPNSARGFQVSGMLRAYAGDTERALAQLQRAVRLNPLDRAAFASFGFALAYFVAGRYEEALVWTEQGLRSAPYHAPTLRYRAASLGLLGRVEDGPRVVRQLRTIIPDLTVARARAFIEVGMHGPFQPAVVDLFCEGLRRAGLPDR